MADVLLPTILGGVSGGIAPAPYAYLVTQSQNFVFPYKGKVKIWAVGAGGQGAAVSANGLGTPFMIATGGGSGGVALKVEYAVDVGQIITCTIGAGGAASVLLSGAGINGADGGDTTVTGTGISLSAGGGKGGKFDLTGALFTLPGGLGGIATGGDFNYPGGRGGDIANIADPKVVATGGGSWNPFSAGYRGGDVDNALVGSAVFATGGGGYSGRGGDITTNTVSVATGGGGITDGVDATTSVSATAGGFGFSINANSYSLYHPGQVTIYNGTNGDVSGGINIEYSGSGGIQSTGTETYSTDYFGGTGGAARGSSSNVFVGGVGFGGGTGAAVNSNTASGTAQAVAGSNGLVIIQYTEITS